MVLLRYVMVCRQTGLLARVTQRKKAEYGTVRTRLSWCPRRELLPPDGTRLAKHACAPPGGFCGVAGTAAA